MMQGTLFPTPETTLVVVALPQEIDFTFMPTIKHYLYTGVGKIEATLALTKELALNPDITTVINYGTAGGAFDVERGHIYPITTFMQGDYNCCLPGLDKGPVTFPAWNFKIPNKTYTCVTQDSFVNSVQALELLQKQCEGWGRFNCVDMESYALATVCKHFDVDFICYKYISDGADESANDEWHENVDGGADQFLKLLEKHHGFRISDQ